VRKKKKIFIPSLMRRVLCVVVFFSIKHFIDNYSRFGYSDTSKINMITEGNEMKTRCFNFIFVVLVSVLPVFLWPGEKEKKTPQIEYNPGLVFYYNRVPIQMGENKIQNNLEYYMAALEIDVDIMDYLTVGAIAGYNQNRTSSAVNFTQLPLSLRLNDESFNSIVLGLKAKSEFFSWEDFTFTAQGNFNYFKLFKKEFPIELPIETGSAVFKNSFHTFNIELLIQYDGLNNFTLYAGPQINVLKGKFHVLEEIDTLKGEETLSYKQRHTFGALGGARFELGSHFDVNVMVNLISKSSLGVEIFYVF